MAKFIAKIEKLSEVKYKGPPGAFMNKKRVRLYELEDIYFDCEMEWKIWLANREKTSRGSKRDPRLALSSSLDQCMRASSSGTTLTQMTLIL